MHETSPAPIKPSAEESRRPSNTALEILTKARKKPKGNQKKINLTNNKSITSYIHPNIASNPVSDQPYQQLISPNSAIFDSNSSDHNLSDNTSIDPPINDEIVPRSIPSTMLSMVDIISIDRTHTMTATHFFVGKHKHHFKSVQIQPTTDMSNSDPQDLNEIVPLASRTVQPTPTDLSHTNRKRSLLTAQIHEVQCKSKKNITSPQLYPIPSKNPVQQHPKDRKTIRNKTRKQKSRKPILNTDSYPITPYFFSTIPSTVDHTNNHPQNPPLSPTQAILELHQENQSILNSIIPYTTDLTSQQKYLQIMQAPESDNIICTLEGIGITIKTFQRLKPGAWLSTDIIDSYTKILAKEYPHIWFANAGFYNQLVHPHTGYLYQRVKKIVRRHQIFHKRSWIIPIYRDNNHWALIYVDTILKLVHYHDSKHYSGVIQLNHIQKFILDATTDENSSTAQEQSWTLIDVRNTSTGQSNPYTNSSQVGNNDCGIFLLAFVHLKCNGLNMHSFQQHHVLEARKRIGIRILKEAEEIT